MKLKDICEDAGTRLSPELLQIAFDAVRHEKLSVSDITELTKEIGEEGYDRTRGSARFSLSRMHILVHGIAPIGMTERSAETFFQPSGPMYDFVEAKGIDVDRNVDNAKEEIKTRLKPVRAGKARELFAAYYKDNKDRLKINRANFTGKNYRNGEEVKRMIMTGMSPEDAFAPFL